MAFYYFNRCRMELFYTVFLKRRVMYIFYFTIIIIIFFLNKWVYAKNPLKTAHSRFVHTFVPLAYP